jgi:colicin import membrane protein
MSAQAVLGFGFGERRQPALGRSFVLAFLVHALLVGVMFLGVRWQSHDPETVTVELWEAPPPAPPPAPRVVEAPKPQPAPPPPVAKPEPKVEKPDIAIREKPKPKPKPVAKPKPEAKPEPPKRDLAFEQRLREQVALEQKALAEQQRLAEAQQRERELQALIAKKQADARQGALSAWIGRISGRIRSNIPVSVVEEVQGNPEAIFDVTLLPTGEVLTAVRRKSSGNRAYDEAVERAILKSSPLPKPDDPGVFQRRLELVFRPQDK